MSDRATAFLALLTAAAALWACNVRGVEVEVVGVDGRVIVGELIDQDAKVITLEIAGISTPIPRDRIETIRYRKTADEEFAQRRRALAGDDYDGRYELARDMLGRDRGDLALQELRRLSKQNPDDERVDRLIHVIENRMRLESERAVGSSRPRTARPETPEGAASPDAQNVPATPENLLSEQQINLIKLWELPDDFDEARPRIRVVIPRDTVEQLFKDYASNESIPRDRGAKRRFRRLRSSEQLQLFFDVQARSLYDQITVRDDPPTLARFRRTINSNFIVPYFRRHFGRGQVPGLMLFGSDPNRAREAYTNFFILSTVKLQGLPVIDRAAPERSLLLQWSLPRDVAAQPAPEQEGWEPHFTGIDDPRYTQVIDWISALYDPLPAYGVDYKPPGGVETEEPDGGDADEGEPAQPRPATPPRRPAA